ncbi:hypothetical protein [Bacteroides sp. 51]|uniref:hypothetical protein n=1 Tax=Bacteroides sp. 51 TaxID=2302938 RepID=UPI0013D16899|nr:hypothetical protein [Bacteroides sp. 51]NDV81171.1 hypothetical protein [Bacteroides sp. 51]
MKRLVLAAMAVICLSASSFAAGKQPTTATTWEGNINVTKLSNYLKLSSAQTEEVANITTFFDEQMGRATRAKKNQDKMLQNAVYGNLKLMKGTLSAEQYAKYIKLMNVTLQNRGIEIK